MAKRLLRVERVVELIDQFLEEEDFPESSDDELDVSVRCDFVEEDTGEEILLTNIPTISSNNDLSRSFIQELTFCIKNVNFVK